MGDWWLKVKRVHSSCSYVRYTAHSFRIHCRRYSGTHQFLALASKATNCGKFSLRRFINSTRMGSNSSTLRRWRISIIHSSDVRPSFEILFPFCLFVVSLTKLISLSKLCCYAAFWDLLENWVKRFSFQLQNALFQWNVYMMNFILADFYRVEASWVIPPILSISFLIKSLPRQFHLKTRNWLKSKMET